MITRRKLIATTLAEPAYLANVARAQRRSIRWSHYPLYCMDFRSSNLSFA